MAELIGLLLDTLIQGGVGVLLILYAKGIWPKNPKNPERAALHREKYGKFFIYGGVIAIICALIQFVTQFAKISTRL